MRDGGEHQHDGRLVGGRYRLIERIGSGGMGTVWRALDELVEREVAVKQPRLPGDPEDESRRRAAHRLYREARAAARVDHPAAVSIHDVVVEADGPDRTGGLDGLDGLPWIVMELVRGESLQEVLERGPVDASEAARIGLAVLGALRAAHSVGIVHRDIKPANVLLGPHGRVVLTDFGIAHVQGEESLTVGGEFVGSLEFVAPERMSGRSAGPASDLWSLGVLLYAAVEGRSPFRRTTVESTLAAVLAADPPEPRQPGPLGPLISRLLAKEPERRPAARSVAAVLEAAAAGWPAPESPGDGDGDAGGAGAALTQDAEHLREFAEDAATTRLRAPETDAGREPETAQPEPATVTTSEPDQKPRRRLLRHSATAALLGLLLVGGTWLTTSSFLVEADSGPRREHTPDTWIPHRERGMDAVLSLPGTYREAAREGSAGDQPRLVVYDLDATVQIRLTQWDRAPGSPISRAREAHRTLDGYDGDARTQYTRTSVQGYEAVMADTAYGLQDNPTRVMQVFIRTDDGRMYVLRVDMPKGTPDEKEGTAVFKGARDRLEIGRR